MTTQFRRKQYSGPLSPGEIAIGMETAKKNAARLLHDATLLTELGRYPSACSLAILSIEEMGKWEVLRTLAVARDEMEIKAAWKEYRDHRSKNCRWALASSVRPKDAKMDYVYMAHRDGWHTAFIDAIKQAGFYTDCVEDREWTLPEQDCSAALAKELVAIATELLPNKTITSREIELWIEHMGGGIDDLDDLKERLQSFATAMAGECLSDNLQHLLEKMLTEMYDGNSD